MSQQQRKADASLMKVLVPVIVLIVGGGVVFALTKLPTSEPEAQETPPPEVNVTVMEVEPIAELRDTFEIKGSTEAWKTIRLVAETTGCVERITVYEGDAATMDQPLVYLDDDIYVAQADQARAQAEFDAREVKRLSRALGGGAATEMELDAARSKAAASKAAMELAEERLRQTVIRAPASVHDPAIDDDQVGRVSQIDVELGECLAPGQAVARLLETRCIRVVADVPELDIRYLTVGQEAEVIVEALGDRKVAGVVHYIEPVADPSTRTYRTEIKVPNDDGAIMPGMFVRVRMLRRVISDAIMIPFDAAAPLERDYEVYVSTGESAERRYVSLDTDVIIGKHILAGPSDRGRGLEPGDMLIVQGQRLVGDGQTIAVREAPKRLLAALNDAREATMAAASRPAEKE